METEKIKLVWSANDPLRWEKTGRFFIEANRLNREQMSRRETPESGLTLMQKDQFVTYRLENLPTDYINRETFMFVLQTCQTIDQGLDRLHPETDDPQLAAVCATATLLLWRAKIILSTVFGFLLSDSRFQVRGSPREKSTGRIRLTVDGEAWRAQTTRLMLFPLLCNGLHPDETPNAPFLPAVQILQFAGETFYTLLQTVFRVPSIGKCHQAFSHMMQLLGSSRAEKEVDDYIRLFKTMVIDLQEASTGTDVKSLEKIQNLLLDLCRKVEKMEGLLKTCLLRLEKVLNGFVKLFRPGQPRPTQQELRDEISMSKVDMALANLKEPRKSIVLAVVRETERNPIVSGSRKGNGPTLSSTARKIWNTQHLADKGRQKGAFRNFNQLKSTCYHIQNTAKFNPFVYKK